MPIRVFENGRWRKETKEEVMAKEDIEGNNPCEKCWKQARRQGVLVWPLKENVRHKRCPNCGRSLGRL